MQSARIQLLVSVVMSVFLLGSHNVIAHELGHWSAGSNKVWKSGFGGCWDTGFAGNPNSECGEPAPVAAPSKAIYWNDEDGDGVHDADDACPKTPLGVPVNSSGCVNDNDGDGVPDYLDKCPETPLGTVVDTNGCAYILVTLEGVHFAFDSANLTSVAKSILDNAARTVNAHSAAHFTIEGHTDSYGSDDYNQSLSERRAQSVKNYLESKGVSSGRLTAVGKGESSPVASNDTREGRAENRRVQVLAR